MRPFLILLGGMLVWMAQFFLLYGIASAFGTTGLARLLSGLVTLAALGADLALLAVALRFLKTAPRGGVMEWPARMGALGAALSLLAVVWQGLPALLV